jgi:membrane protein implicated in regulation of membrane protease activity
LNRRRRSRKIIVRYTLFQLPGLALLGVFLFFVRRWVDIPAWLLVSIVGFWVAKDIIMYPYTWRSYDTNRTGDPNSIVGLRGIARDRLAPAGYVEVHGELWQAEVSEGDPPIEQGEAVRVQGIRGLILIVQPDH